MNIKEQVAESINAHMLDHLGERTSLEQQTIDKTNETLDKIISIIADCALDKLAVWNEEIGYKSYVALVSERMDTLIPLVLGYDPTKDLPRTWYHGKSEITNQP